MNTYMSLSLERSSSVVRDVATPAPPATSGASAPYPRAGAGASLSLPGAAAAHGHSQYLPLNEDDSLDMVLFDVLREASGPGSASAAAPDTYQPPSSLPTLKALASGAARRGSRTAYAPKAATAGHHIPRGEAAAVGQVRRGDP
jgi:hypothetical protein|uniref:Uncharacterized protein n=1 Tax=Zea mays TaxID=4577 RepID=A0A804QYG0_MAIZE